MVGVEAFMQQATLLFLQDGERVLLGRKKRGFGEGLWNGIGGKVKPGETVYDALVRECQEEIGVTPRNCRKVGTLAVMCYEMLVHIFTTRAWEGEPVESEEMEPRWFETRSVPYERMWSTDRLWLPETLQRKTSQERHLRIENGEVIVYDRIDS
jgi:8-oxo-dGTP pyrophosphatase MutT (NUDIX family)